jgi:serralysin
VAEIEEWCFSWFAIPPSDTRTRAALQRDAKWAKGDTITVSFLDGDPSVHSKVIRFAREWTKLANLSFDFKNGTTRTDIRISFKFPGSWSVVGTTCKTITDLSKPTMNFGTLTPSTPDDAVRRVVLHEFGHALGLIHEHQNPAGGIPWNRAQVLNDLSGPPNKWSEDVVNRNMFDVLAEGESNHTKLDPASIMMYPIPTKWTTNGWTVGLNSTLSPTDRSFIQDQYPDR